MSSQVKPSNQIERGFLDAGLRGSTTSVLPDGWRQMSFFSHTDAHVFEWELASSRSCFFMISTSPQATETTTKVGQERFLTPSALR